MAMIIDAGLYITDHQHPMVYGKLIPCLHAASTPLEDYTIWAADAAVTALHHPMLSKISGLSIAQHVICYRLTTKTV